MNTTSTETEPRWAAFGRAIDAVRKDAEARIGAEDLRHVRRLDALSRTFEVAGRGLLWIAFEPVTFALGTVLLFLHKQLQATEIGHTALHGAFDKIPGVGRFHSERFRWETPIDEASWRHGHNVRHHQYTNVTGKDPDIHFGPVRLTEGTPYRAEHARQLPLTLLLLFPNFGFLMNLHFTGALDLLHDNGLSTRYDFVSDRGAATRREVLWKLARSYVPYYGKEFVLFPVLAALTGFSPWKVLLGTWLAETMRDVYTAATIYCGHVGAEVASYPEGTKARGRGEFYAMQAAASNDFEVPLPLSILCGGLDLQIEHHMFPRLPPWRLREVAPAVRRACEEHGVPYRKASWGATLREALGTIRRLGSRPEAATARP
ncbi:MAG: fatty acid desaturase [Polyangiaceae bacterium]